MRRRILILIWLKRLARYLLVPLAFCLIIFPLYGLMRQQTEQAQLADAAEQLSIAVNVFERYLSDLRFTTNRLFNSDVYKRLAADSGGDAPRSDDPALYEASSLLADLTYNNSYVAYCYVTFARNQFVVDSWRFFNNFSRFYPGALEYRDVSANTWIKWVSTRRLLCLPARSVALNQTSYPDTYLTLCQPYFTSGGQLRGAYTILIREKHLHQLFLPMEKWREEGVFCLVRNNGEVLSSHNYTGDGHIFLEKQTGLESYNNQNYLFISRPLEGLEARAVIALPYSTYGENMRAVTKAVQMYMGAGFTACLLLSIAMTLSDMRYLRPILDMLEEENVPNNRLFADLIVQKLHDRRQLKEDLERIRGELDHSRIEATLRTGAAGTPEEQESICALLGLTRHNYLLLLPLRGGEDGAEMREELRLMMLDEQVRQCYGKPQFVYQTAAGGTLVILTLETGDEREQVQMCRQTEALYTQLNLSAPLVLSSCFTGLDELSSVYWQARNMQRYADDTQKVCYLNGESLVRMATPDVVSLERLNGYLLAGCAQEAQALIREFFSVEELSPQNFQQAFFSVRGVLIGAAQKAGGEDVGYLCSYDSQKPAHQQVQALCDCCFEICSSMELLRRSHNEALQQKILAWLAEQYTKPELNVAMTAGQFGISRKYVTQFLKAQTGKSFSEYVEELRLSHAMELLRDSEYSITEIALQCGFSAQNTFYKAFRRRFGVSPSAMRHGERP